MSGRVAMARWRHFNGTLALYCSARRRWIDTDGAEFEGDEDDLTLRPMLVIDPEAIVHEGEADDDGNRVPEIVNCLRRIAEADGGKTWRARLCLRLADEFMRQNMSPTPPKGTCSAVLNIRGEHFPCQQMDQMAPGSENHDGWAHSNRDAEAIWGDPE